MQARLEAHMLILSADGTACTDLCSAYRKQTDGPKISFCGRSHNGIVTECLRAFSLSNLNLRTISLRLRTLTLKTASLRWHHLISTQSRAGTRVTVDLYMFVWRYARAGHWGSRDSDCF